jgi:quinone-modifying oxidoreductase subunit QmoA
VTLTKGKVAKIEEAAGGDVTVTVEDALTGKKIKKTFDMVVLATGMQPSGALKKVPGVNYAPDGFAPSAAQQKGIVSIGTGKTPLDVQRSVQDSTGAAIKCIQSTAGGK